MDNIMNLNASGNMSGMEYTNFNYTPSPVDMEVGACSNKTTIPPLEQYLVNYKMFVVIVNVFVVGLLCLVGLIGNALSIAVLYKDHDRKNTTNWLLQTLAMTDTLYLLACMFFQTIKSIHDHTNWVPGLKMAFPYMEPYIWTGASIAQTITVWMVMLVTIDRYVAICMPLRMQLRNVKRARCAVLIVICAAIVYNIPRVFEREVVINIDKCTGIQTIKTERTWLRYDSVYFLVYKTIMYFIFRTVGPLFILIALNLRLIRALQDMKRKHKDLNKNKKNKSNKNRENITLMLVAVVSVFIVCEIPDLSLRILLTVMEFVPTVKDGINIWTLRYAVCITNMLLTVNSSINFLIYCLIGKKFRRLLGQMCCPKKKGTLVEASETEPLTMKTNITRNGVSSCNNKDDDVHL